MKTKAEVQAFLDDVSALTRKHGIEIGIANLWETADTSGTYAVFDSRFRDAIDSEVVLDAAHRWLDHFVYNDTPDFASADD
jgi:hypothetical protein